MESSWSAGRRRRAQHFAGYPGWSLLVVLFITIPSPLFTPPQVHGFGVATPVWRDCLLSRSGESVLPNQPSLLSRITPKSKRTLQSPSSTSLSAMIFTRLSEESLSVLSQAQTQAHTLKVSEVNNGCLLAAVVVHEDSVGSSTSISQTLTEWNLSPSKIVDALPQVYGTAAASTKTTIPKLSDFAAATAQIELSLSTKVQQTLVQAGQLSAAMKGGVASPIEPVHILLSLLEYQEIDGVPQAASRSDEDCEAMEVLWNLDATLEADDLCASLLKNFFQAQQQIQDSSSEKSTAKGVGAGAISSKKSEPIVSGTGAAMSEAKEKARSLLQECGLDLTLLAREGQLDKVHGRDVEIQSMCQTLVRRRKNNVCLIGEAGVGKTCLVEALAQLLVSETDCPPALQGHRIISLEVGALLAGTKFRGEFEERLRTIIEILMASRTKSILFIDEIHNLVGAGGNADGNLDASNILKPYLARGQLQVIGATTITEYHRYIAKDPALERRFQPVVVREPTVEETVDILQAVLPFYRSHHRVEFTDEALEAAARLSDRYINDRFLPDKAIDVLDEAGAMATLTRNRTDFEAPTVTDKSITDIISQWTNIPVGKLEMDEMDRLQLLEANLGRRVKGQARAVRTVSKAIRRARTGIRNPRRPVASFLFCGPTGTGKTELCKALADTYYGSERDLIRIDMSEYMEKSSMTRLTGPPPGLVGYEQGGQLTEAVRRSPHSVVLLDELEKAHSDVLNLLLQVLEDGILTDGKGRTISFKNTVLIMTSNIGSKRILDLVQKGNAKSKDETEEAPIEREDDAAKKARQLQREEYDRQVEQLEYNKLARVVKGELERALKPEFLNRIDDIVVFQPLTSTELSMIAVLMVVDITARAKLEKNLEITVDGPLLDIMVAQGSAAASQFGARPMRRAVQRILEDAISDSVVQSFLKEGDAAIFGKGEERTDDEDNRLVVTVLRQADGEVLKVLIDDSSRDLDSDFDNDDEEEEEDGDDIDLKINGDKNSDPTYPTTVAEAENSS